MAPRASWWAASSSSRLSWTWAEGLRRNGWARPLPPEASDVGALGAVFGAPGAASGAELGGERSGCSEAWSGPGKVWSGKRDDKRSGPL
ncbi:MAG: hypothetical protein QXZ28_01505 [Candidatus Methanomethylicaceae archaeon]